MYTATEISSNSAGDEAVLLIIGGELNFSGFIMSENIEYRLFALGIWPL